MHKCDILARKNWTGLPLWAKPIQDFREAIEVASEVFTYSLTCIDPQNASSEVLTYSLTCIDPPMHTACGQKIRILSKTGLVRSSAQQTRRAS